jgi:hypothetical protein
MNIILFFLAIITALVLVILFTPIKYGLEASYEQNLEYSIRLGAGFWWRFSIQQEQQKKSWQLKILGLTVPQGDRKALVKRSKAERAPKQPNKKKSSNSLKTLKSFGENKNDSQNTGVKSNSKNKNDSQRTGINLNSNKNNSPKPGINSHTNSKSDSQKPGIHPWRS